MALNDTLASLPHIPILLLVYFVMRDQMTWWCWRWSRPCSAGPTIRA